MNIQTSDSGGAPKLTNPDKTDAAQSRDEPMAVAEHVNTSSRDAASVHFDGSKTLATPAVRKIAKERGIDLSRLSGSGPGGRVLKEDVLRLQGGSTSSPTPRLAQSTTRVPTSQPVLNQPTFTQPAKVPDSPLLNTVDGVDRKVPIRGVQRLMVASMNAASEVHTIHFSSR